MAINGEKALAAILFLNTSTMTMDVYSALNSSPWTAQSFGGDPEKAKSCRHYVYQSIGVTMFYGVAGSVIAKSPWPIIGTIIADVYMFSLYEHALRKAASSGSGSWGDKG